MLDDPASDAVLTGEAGGSLLARIRRLISGGTASIAAGIAVSNVLRIVSSIVLTRLLDPSAYGVVGFIVSVSYVLAMMSDVGLQPFIIRHKDGGDPRFLDQIWTIRLIRAIALTAAMVLLAKPASALVGKPELANVVAVWSLSFLLDGLGSLAFATGVRNQTLWRVSVLELSTSVISVVSSIVAAILLRNYWAMVIGMIAGQAGHALLSYLIFAQSRRRWAFDPARSRELWQFSRYIALSSMLSVVILQFDKLVLVRLMPLAAYGHYAVASTLAVAPEALANPYGQRILYPLYARVARENRPALKQVFYDARRRVSLLYALAVGGMIGAAPLIIAILYDPRYAPVVPFLQLLTFRSFLRLPVLAANEVLVAIGRTKAVPATNLFRIFWLVIAGAVALWTGEVMVIVIIVALVEVPALLWYWYILAQEKLLSLREESYPFLAGIAGLAAGYAIAVFGMQFFR